MYKTLNQYYKEKFGCKVYKLSIDGGFTCPNRDGTLEEKGCIFCSERGSGEFAENNGSIAERLEAARRRVSSKTKDDKFIAYFQSFTNTYAPAQRLRDIFSEALAPDYIVGLSVATRPDCLPYDTVDMLSELNRIKPVSVELGLQTIHKKSIEYIRRGYENEVYFDAVRRLKAAGLSVVTHIIIGLPGESDEEIAETVKSAVAVGSDGVKFHLLHVIRGTDLERDYLAGRFECLTLERYSEILKKCIAVLPEDTVVHRITGDGDKKTLVAPLWSADKKRVLNYLSKYLED